MASPKSYILTATDQHGVNSPEEYQAEQAAYLKRMSSHRSHRGAPLAVWTNLEPTHVLISGGAWIVRCPCGNAPSVHPVWRIARCFECGAVYPDLVIPPDAADLEDTLIQRPGKYRHWDPARGETVASLKQENHEHGIPGGSQEKPEKPEKPERPPPPSPPGKP